MSDPDYRLYDLLTGEDLGPATAEQVQAGLEAAALSDSGGFDIDADGHPCTSHTRGQREGFVPPGGVRTVYVI